MAVIDANSMTTEALESFDEMMVECAIKVEKVARLALTIWADVPRELDRRGRVKLVSGSYDDIGNALIARPRP